ncbi:hypothetical protein BDW72DRAFT_198726 [Aspergillus terricola var. indicus]
MSCCQDALRNARFRLGRVQNKLRRLWKRCATNLKEDQLVDQYDRQILGLFIKRFSRSASSHLCEVLGSGDGVSSHDLSNLPDGRDPQVKVEQYLTEQYSKRPRDRFALSKNTVPAARYESESDSNSDEGEDDMTEFEFPNLGPRRVLAGCEALQRLRRDLLNFVYPSLDKRVKRLAESSRTRRTQTTWSIVDTTGPGSWSECAVLFLGAAEAWTGMRWDWWPLKPYMRNLSKHERRLSWRCACGEERWMELPAPFVDGLKQCIADHIEMEPRIQVLKQSLSDAPGEYRGAAASSRGSSFLSLSQSPPSTAFQQTKLGLAASSIPSQMNPTNIHPASQTTGQSQPAIERLLSSPRMAKELYKRLKVSHCDFYQFEKFDDSRYAPKLKGDYPKSRDHYGYSPDPMDIIPPISDYEFNSRFYECYCSNKHGLSRFFHPCKKASGHSCDALQLLPKKKAQLERHGHKRQIFWGIYAQEIVCFRWVVAYHVACLLPMVVFFFL